ncbi:IclR family transcriptional regulator [Leekyejoonella antrihumi]|uniref:Glycerol operon regulatory protein n=1 Tax=Leekyejoonella antrihumi TaxID=1660198 RepID=A0A563DW75_9MICO|nr:IclR family transcriptional regulator [Leekyejoonella antrihumi]TWP34538.1 IclR family transcriptional regulator [Leekyejoonella antrihumi]
MTQNHLAPPERIGTRVRSLDRAFDILETVAEAGGSAGVSEISLLSGLPMPTIHRLAQTLVDRGYLRKEPSRRYSLGPRLIGLGEATSSLLGTWARPYLARLVDSIGETANLAALDGDLIVYAAQVPSKHSMRLFTAVGRSALPHTTAVGKALLADVDPETVRMLLGRTGMAPATEHTITSTRAFAEALTAVRAQGYAMDDGEQEVGVRCVAVAVPGIPSRIALSVSGPRTRMSDAVVERAVPELRCAAEQLGAEPGVRTTR